MRRFPLEPVFWRSLLHACLRCLGLSRKRAYRVIVLAEPVWLADAETGVLGSFGVFTTRAVVADSESSARDAAVALVRDAVLRMARNPEESPVLFQVEENEALQGVAWRQGSGFSVFPAE